MTRAPKPTMTRPGLVHPVSAGVYLSPLKTYLGGFQAPRSPRAQCGGPVAVGVARPGPQCPPPYWAPSMWLRTDGGPHRGAIWPRQCLQTLQPDSYGEILLW